MEQPVEWITSSDKLFPYDYKFDDHLIVNEVCFSNFLVFFGFFLLTFRNYQGKA